MNDRDSGGWVGRWGKRLGVIVAATFVALIATEVGLRAFHLMPAGGIATLGERGFARLPGLYVPGQRLVDRRVPALAHRITIDSLGYRGTSDFSREKPPGELRILMLGDSFTYGDFVNDEETLPAQLERLLGERCDHPVRVINIGVGGSSIETAAVMARRALPLGIDLAVLTFSENDVTDLAAPMWEQMTANRKAKSEFPLSVLYPVLRRLATWNLMLTVQAKLRNRRTARIVKPADPAPGMSAVPRLRHEYAARLGQLAAMLDSAKVPLTFAIFPSHLSVYGLWSSDQLPWVRAMADSAGLPVVDFTPALQQDGRGKEELYLLPLDGHPSRVGYAIAAGILATALETTTPLASSCTAATAARP